MNFLYNPNFYYVSIVLQGFCAWHCIKKGHQQKWIWIIVCMPFIGCIAYAFSEIFTSRDLQNVQKGMGSIISSAGSIKKLEENLKFSNTFNNKVALADAYFSSNQIDKAVPVYESCLNNYFTEHEYVNSQLILCYYEQKRYTDIIEKAKAVYNKPQFQKTRAHMLYAMALSLTNQPVAAEAEFKLLKGKFANYESRYYYGLFLLQLDRTDEAIQLYQEVLSEANHLTGPEKRNSKQWFALIKDRLKELQPVKA